MRKLSIGLALAVLPALGASGVLPPVSVTVYTDFQQNAPPAVVDAIESELAGIMSPIGFHFEWRQLSANDGGEVSAELAVVTFRGSCAAQGLKPVSASPGVLGWTHVSDGAILPFSEIDCDGIRHFVQSALLKSPPDTRQEKFGRAVGRVLAHELYHIFANTRHHGENGVGKATYTVQELLAKAFRFEERETEALRAGRAETLVAGAKH